jgi:cyclopropane fatty-acyl-phospholipid synthase-like methyltransferase
LKSTENIYIKTKDFLLSGEEFTLVENKEKDLLKTIPVPENVSEYYQSENYISHTDSNKTLFDKAYQLVKKVALSQKLSLIKKLNQGEGALLDIGSGTGDFLVYAKNKNWNVQGVEPGEKARQLSEKKGIVVNEFLQDVEEKYFDVITLWHAFEHVEDFESYILEIKKRLKPGGTLIVAVPNFKSKDAKHYKEHWAAFDVPRHLWHFSKSSIERIFSPHDFKLIQTKPMWFDAFYVSLLSEKYKTGKSNWVKAIWYGSLSNLSGIFTKEYSSHIYILKKEG